MSPLAVLLRVLLSLALILNGSVPVVHAAMARATPDDAPAVDRAPGGDDAPEMTMGEGGCHDERTIDVSLPTGAEDHGEDSGSDCCSGDGDCRNACAQHCPVSMPGIACLYLTLAPVAGPLPITVATQPDPRLRDRIRPPIA